MILILGKSLIFWSGGFGGLFFFLSYFGCKTCNMKSKKLLFIQKYHKLFMNLATLFILIHIIVILLG